MATYIYLFCIKFIFDSKNLTAFWNVIQNNLEKINCKSEIFLRVVGENN